MLFLYNRKLRSILLYPIMQKHDPQNVFCVTGGLYMKLHSEFRSFSKYVTLNILGMIGLSCYILADTFYIARGLGANGLAALNLAIPLYSVVYSVGIMIGIGGATRYSICRAQGDLKRADTVFTHMAGTALAAGILFSLAGLFFSGSLSRLMGADEQTFALTSVYLQVVLGFSPFFILNQVFLAMVRNDGNPNLAMAGMLIGSLSNIVLDYLFIFPLGMGMFGAALATGFAPVISMLILSRHLIQKKNQFHLRRCRPEPRLVGDIACLGLSSFVTELSSGIVLIVFNLVILKLAGNTGLAAYGIIANLSLVAQSVFTGIAQGIQPLLSRHYGFGQNGSVRRIRRYAFTLSLFLSLALYLAVVLLRSPLTAAFNSGGDQLLASYAKQGMVLYFPGFFFAGINILLAACFSAVDQAGRAFFLSVTRGCALIIPIVFLLSSFLGLRGVWLSFPCAEALTLLLAGVLFLHPSKKEHTGSECSENT